MECIDFGSEQLFTRNSPRSLFRPDAAGKTSLIYRLKLGKIVTTIPTIGFLDWKGIQICAWGIGGRSKIRPLYQHFYSNTGGLIFVIDSNDRERLDEALQELVVHILMKEELKETVVMVLANKQDLPSAMPAQEVEDILRKMYPVCSQTVFVKPCSVETGEGMHEAFNEFVNQLKLRQKGIHTSGIISIPASSPAVKDDQFSQGYKYTTLKAFLKHPLAVLRSYIHKGDLSEFISYQK